MNISRRWLEDFLRRPLDAADAAERLAMLGAAVDAVEPLHPGLGGVIVGLVEEVRPHPNADRLHLCTVNDGTPDRRQVVCGAPNVTAGRRYPFAPVGAVLPGEFKIEGRKIRGEASEGMLCSARELGLGQEHDGILELATEAPPGTALLDVLPVADDRLVLDVTPNRPDLLGHKGVARELAASYGVPFRLPEIPASPGSNLPTPQRSEVSPVSVGAVAMGLEDPEGCPRFLGALLAGVTVGPSPAWLRGRLEAVGMRTINNVVDATNYVMFELNQPMHPYDVSRLRGPAVVARRARPGERLVTLDHVDRVLTDEMTVIADAAGAIGVAGVMGAAHVEVSETTTEVFLECAFFEPRRIRRTRRTLGLSTEASHRFERGIDRWGGAEALRRCVEIIQATAGGELVGEPADLWPEPTHPPRVFLRPSRVAQVLGVELPWSDLEKYLLMIGASVLAKPEDGRLAVDVPGWRPDLVAEIDLIEEIARLHGFDRFPESLRPFRLGQLVEDPMEAAVATVRAGLVARGLLEAQTLPFGPAEGAASVRLLNPLSAEEAHLRQNLLPGLLRRVEANWSARVRDVRLFEIGTVFSQAGPGQRPHEEHRVAVVLTGARAPAHWTDTGPSPDLDLWDLKDLFQAAIALAIPDAKLQVDKAAYLACGLKGEVLGRAEPLDASIPAWAAPVFGLELSLSPGARLPVRFRELPATPSSSRDLA
ncbi:MAG: phenylalanine--tRNA ligase subunit beta, partial [Gemmatimonadales bacterium]